MSNLLKRPATAAARRKCIHPFPVYAASLRRADGTAKELRLSFWAPKNASHETMTAYGRSFIEHLLGAELSLSRGCTLEAGHVIDKRNGCVIADDVSRPLEELASGKKRKATTAQEYKAMMRKLLLVIDGGRPDADEIRQARTLAGQAPAPAPVVQAPAPAPVVQAPATAPAPVDVAHALEELFA